MKFGVRTPSLKRRISARTSPKRYVRQTLGIKASRGMGIVTNPKRALYNRVYNRTSVSVDRLVKASRPDTAAKRLDAKTSHTSLSHPYMPFMYERPSSFALWSWRSFGAPKNIARAYVADSVRAFREGNYQEALEMAQQGYDANPDNNATWYLIGACSNNLGDDRTAAEYLAPYIKSNYDDLHAQYVLGISYVRLGEYDKAKELAKGLILRLGYHVEAVWLLGIANFMKGDYENALGAFKRAPLRRQIDSDTLLDVHYWLGATYEKLGINKSAHAAYQRVSNINANLRDVTEALKRTA